MMSILVTSILLIAFRTHRVDDNVYVRVGKKVSFGKSLVRVRLTQDLALTDPLYTVEFGGHMWNSIVRTSLVPTVPGTRGIMWSSPINPFKIVRPPIFYIIWSSLQ